MSFRYRGWTGRTKYNSRKVTRYGITFDSKLELAVYEYLLVDQQEGQLFSLTHHPKPYVYLTLAEIEYRPDFSAYLPHGELVYFEAKGKETASWKLKRRLWEYYGPGRLRIFAGTYQRFAELPEIVPQGYNFKLQSRGKIHGHN